jgi:hypothetical protein
MKIEYGTGPTPYGPGVNIKLDAGEIVLAIHAWLVANDVHIVGPRTITMENKLLTDGKVYVDPVGRVIFKGEEFSGRGPILEE